MSKARKNKAALPDQEQRDAILTELDQNMLVEAAAGTGKTTSMVGRMIALLRTGTCEDISTLAAITFTRKAAAELRSRFQDGLERAARDAVGEEQRRLALALSRVERCFIGTIHSFCGRLLRERPVEAGVKLDFAELEEKDDKRLRADVWQETAARIAAEGRPITLDRLGKLGLSVQDLEPAFDNFCQYADVDEWPRPKPNPPPFEEARLREELVSYLAHMREIALHLPEDPGSDELMPLYRDLPRMATHLELSDRGQLISLLERFGRKPKFRKTSWRAVEILDHDGVNAIETRWNTFREQWVQPFFAALFEERYGPILDVLTAARELYDTRRAQMSGLNFQDLLMKSAALLRDKPHVRRYFKRRFTHLLVDEFHDTDPIQAETMLLLTATDPAQTRWRECVPEPGSLFVVGDPKQSIYRFRRADIVTYNEVKEILKRHGRTVALSANFRSSPEIIDWVNRVFEPGDDSGDTGRPVLRFPARANDHSPAYVHLQAGGQDRRSAKLGGLLRLGIPDFLKRPEVAPYEADQIARTIRWALDTGLEIPRSDKERSVGVGPKARPEDFLIVTYHTLHLSEYGAALGRYGIPHVVTGGSALSEVEELRLLHTLLAAVIHPDDPVKLVAALRGSLFGVSDQALYAFKKAGGRFSFQSRVPEGLAEEHAAPITDAFEKLRLYRDWLDRQPRIGAVEQIAAHCGLLMRAALSDGGPLAAGSVAKGIEILRSADTEAWSHTGLLDRLADIVDEQPIEKYDGQSALPESRSVVRVMNLHKVKGLEAPVVFLANPAGENDHPPTICIDRSGEKVIGHLAISQKGPWRSEIISVPAGWAALSEKEQPFLDAEKLRLRYVAATRAGNAMVVTQWDSPKNRSNPWQYFDPYLDPKKEIDDPGPQAAPKLKPKSLTKKAIAAGHKKIAADIEKAKQPTYKHMAAKVLALSETPPAPKQAEPNSTGQDRAPGGPEWGTVIHRLLEARMKDPGADLEKLASDSLSETGLPIDLAPAAVSLVQRVTESALWRRAQMAEQHLVEVPFHVLLDKTDGQDVPTLVRGAIDLVFKEKAGWVIVDYKTDNTDKTSPAQLAERYAPQLRLYARAWEKCLGEKVAEAGVFFVGPGEMASVRLRE